MHLIKTQEGSHFYRFHDNSSAGKEVLSSTTSKVNGRPVDVLQVAHYNSKEFNVIIEFVYKDNI